jgi:uncharacterized protein YtpQ (UPF0354 family)
MPWLPRRSQRSPQDQFADEVVVLVKNLLGLKARKLPDFALEIDRETGSPTTMNLHNIFIEAEKLSDEARVSRLRTAVLAMTPQSRPSTWDEASPRLLPAVRSASWVAAGGPLGVLRRPIAPFVSLLCAIDSEHAMTFATKSDLKAWAVTEQDAMDKAEENLRARPIEVGRTESTAIVVGPDGYVSSWLAVPAALARVAADIGEVVIAIAPARDVLWLADAEDHTETVQMLERAIAEYQGAPRQLSPVPYLVSPDGIEVWEPAASHPARRLVKTAVRLLAAVEYGYQQAKLQDLMTKGGEDVLIAKYNLMQREDGTVWSWSSWVKQVTNGLIPRADVVLFGDSEDADVKFAVQWDDVVRFAEEALEQEGYDPPLWRYHGWPEAPRLAALRQNTVPFPPPA